MFDEYVSLLASYGFKQRKTNKNTFENPKHRKYTVFVYSNGRWEAFFMSGLELEDEGKTPKELERILKYRWKINKMESSMKYSKDTKAILEGKDPKILLSEVEFDIPSGWDPDIQSKIEDGLSRTFGVRVTLRQRRAPQRSRLSYETDWFPIKTGTWLDSFMKRFKFLVSSDADTRPVVFGLWITYELEGGGTNGFSCVVDDRGKILRVS